MRRTCFFFTSNRDSLRWIRGWIERPGMDTGAKRIKSKVRRPPQRVCRTHPPQAALGGLQSTFPHQIIQSFDWMIFIAQRMQNYC